MKIAIRYHSRTGNTKKLADAIGSAVNVRAEQRMSPSPNRLTYCSCAVPSMRLV